MTGAPVVPSQPGCPTRGGRVGRFLGRALLRLFGWRIVGDLPAEPRFVLIVAPHTSNWDFIIGVFAMFGVGLRASWLGKHTIFRFPVAGLLRWLGGEPVDRSTSHGTVELAVERFQSRPQWVLAISPEGTRKPMPRWKTGFYRIALGAGVPILPVAFDYSRRVVDLGTPVWLTGDEARDLAGLRARFSAGMARHPSLYVEDPPTRLDATEARQ